MEFVLRNRKYKIVATFDNTEEGTELANKYMMDNEKEGSNPSVLHVSEDTIYLADKEDLGTPVKRRWGLHDHSKT